MEKSHNKFSFCFLVTSVILFSIYYFTGGFAAYSAYAYYNPGTPTGFVNDFAGMLKAETRQTLEAKLEQFEATTTDEIAVVTITSLQGDYIENFAAELFKDWGIGKKGKDNGVLILIAKDDRKMRIEVGYGLEPVLTDLESKKIIDTIMRPAFQGGDYDTGIVGAVDAVTKILSGEEVYFPTQKDSTRDIEFFFNAIIWSGFVIMWLGSIFARSKSWWLGGVVGGIFGVIIAIIIGILAGIIALFILIPVGLLFDFIVSRAYQKGVARGHIPWWIGGRGFGGRGGGGFSGFGGGSSGGGGASGSW